MGQVRKDNIKDYWSTDPTVSTPIFPNIMSRKTDLKAFAKPGILLTVTRK
jgi:hypothetical protein